MGCDGVRLNRGEVAQSKGYLPDGEREVQATR